MFDELAKYKQTDHFFFRSTDNLLKVCNAPADCSGVYIVYALQKGKIELIYIGCSGKINEDGRLFIRPSGIGGIKDRLVNGKQFGKPRRNSWRQQLINEDIEALDVYWYVTHNNSFIDSPRELEKKLLKKFKSIYGRLPKWNNKF